MKLTPGRCLSLSLMLGWNALVLLPPPSACALDPDRTLSQYNHQTWKRDEGLPANAIHAIAQTTDGRLWLGTSKGLIYFDGMEFRTVPLAENQEGGKTFVTTLARRGAGGLWLGLDRGGFGLFDGRQLRPVRRPGWSDSVDVHMLVEAGDGSLLLAATAVGGRLSRNQEFLSLKPSYDADITVACEDARGRVWIGTSEHGLFYWENGRMNEFPDPVLRGSKVCSVTVDPAGQIWVGMSNGLRLYDTNLQPQTLSTTYPQVKALLVDKQGTLWVGTIGAGLMRYKQGQFTSIRKQDGLADDRVLSLAQTEDGSLWVGTEDGLTQISDVKFPILSSAEGLPTDACLALAPGRDGGFWAGTGNGLSHYRGGAFTNYGFNGADGFRSRWVKRVFAASDGDVYCIGAHKNLDCFSGDRVVLSWTGSVWPRAIAEDARGIIVAMNGDLMRIESDQMTPYRLSNGSAVSLDTINELLVARDGSLWIATGTRVVQIKDGALRDWTRENRVPSTGFFYLCEDSHGAIWASQDKGIMRFKDGRVSLVSRQQGLHDDFVYAIVPDMLGNLWLDSSSGISTVTERDLNAVADGTIVKLACKVYEGPDAAKTTDKAAPQEYSGIRTADGRIWFPSSKGVVMIDPTRVPTNPRPPPVWVDRVHINGQTFRTDREPTVEPGPGNLAFDYSALDYVAPQKVQYRYRLDGLESEWVDAGNRRSAFYTNLKPGRYSFQVQACNADGVWNTTGASFGLKLPYRFYETLGFRFGCALALLVFGTFVWRVQHLRHQHAELQKANAIMENANAIMEAKVSQRTAELAYANEALRLEVEERKKRAQAETERLQHDLLAASREAGQAEIATSVLHNVGNVLNSVNVSTTLIGDRIRRLGISNVGRVADLMQQHAADLGDFLVENPKGRQVPVYLTELGHHLREQQDQITHEVSTLAEHITHIKDIVAMQQSYAAMGGVLENVAVSEVVESAIQLQTGGFTRHDINLVRDYEELPQAIIDRQRLIQIMVNLLRNAQSACDETPDKTVTVRIKRATADRLRIEVADTGIGIPPENLTKIFSHGFTTRKDGHGFGLHSSLQVATEMGGTLTAQSPGHGKGATFILEMPISGPNKAPAGAPGNTTA